MSKNWIETINKDQNVHLSMILSDLHSNVKTKVMVVDNITLVSRIGLTFSEVSGKLKNSGSVCRYETRTKIVWSLVP